MLKLQFRNCFNLFVSILTVFALFCARAYSQSPITFDHDDFKFVKRLGAHSYDIQPISGTTRYRLTDAIAGQTVAMWHTSKQIDLSKDFIFNFRIKFGDGQNNYQQSIADGIIFVMHTL